MSQAHLRILPDAIAQGRSLVSRGEATREHPAAVGHTGQPPGVVTYYVLPWGYERPEGFIVDILVPEGDL